MSSPACFVAMANVSCVTNPVNISPRNVLVSASVGLVNSPARTSTNLAAKTTLHACQDAGNGDENYQSRRTMLWSGAVAAAAFILESGNIALADVKISLSNIQATPVPCPEGQTTVTGGTSFGVRCFRITGDANNPVKQPVYNADIFGRVYDAQGEPALDAAENLRIDTLAEIPPGNSKDVEINSFRISLRILKWINIVEEYHIPVTFQITVNEGQAKLGPLQLKNFKATGYLGKVNNRQGSGRLDDMDFSEVDEDYVP